MLVRKQQDLGRRTGGVLEGRDIGTKVFPETPFKFFLTARPEVRARRRQRDLQDRGIQQPLETVLAEMLQRDFDGACRGLECTPNSLTVIHFDCLVTTNRFWTPGSSRAGQHSPAI